MTGWHGESSGACSGGHVTVNFYKGDGTFVARHYVYPTDESYRGKLGSSIRHTFVLISCFIVKDIEDGLGKHDVPRKPNVNR